MHIAGRLVLAIGGELGWDNAQGSSFLSQASSLGAWTFHCVGSGFPRATVPREEGRNAWHLNGLTLEVT